MSAVVAATHRLVLSGAEWALLCRLAGVTSPAGFGPGENVAESQPQAAAAALADRGVLLGGEQLHPSVAANLAIFARPDVLLRTDVTVGDSGLRAAHVVRGPLGCSLFALSDAGVELSMFPAVALGRELIRCVPDPSSVDDSAGDDAIRAAFGTGGVGMPPLRGRLPLAALADLGFYPSGRMGRSPTAGAEVALAGRLTSRTSGVLHCLAVGVNRADGAHRGVVLVGDVLWLLVDAGWVGLAPRPDGSGQQQVDVVPASREEIGTWLAPYLARMLAGAVE